ncbi:MAG: AraC family transcriptional regulator [Proteobacteria bacterium]|nr:AraC family transcriptional regulator [Pseudomonadota bacterium]
MNSSDESIDTSTLKNSIYFWAGRLLFARRRLDTAFHAHHAAAVIMAFDDPFVIETEDKRIGPLFSAIISPDTYHKSIAPNSDMIVLLIDPESGEYESFVSTGQSGTVHELDKSIFIQLKKELLRLFDGVSCQKAWEISQEILAIINKRFSEKTQLKYDTRVQKIIEKLRIELPERICIRELEKEVCISGDRLMRLFKEHTGLPLRRYLLWSRLLRSSSLLKQGYSLTDAAHESGFSDAAHMSRTFKKNFGFTPSFFFSKNEAVDFHFCNKPRV